MLREFAFTPQVFDPNAALNNQRWRDCIEAICVRLFTQPAPPVLIAGLHANELGCTWEHTTRTIISAIEDQNSRVIAQQLFTRVSDVLARRPPCSDWPGDDELGWGREAAESHMVSPLDLVIAQDVKSVPAPTPAVRLGDALSAPFWTALQHEHPAPCSLAEEVARLRTILLHADHIVISAPYPSLIEFAIECIRAALGRPNGFRRPEIHVHQGMGDRGDPVPLAARYQHALSHVGGSTFVKCWFWQKASKYRERVVLGGRVADLGGGKTKLVIRTGVAMTHVWGEGNPADAEPSTWSLLSPSVAKRHADLLDKRIADLGLLPVQLHTTV